MKKKGLIISLAVILLSISIMDVHLEGLNTLHFRGLALEKMALLEKLEKDSYNILFLVSSKLLKLLYEGVEETASNGLNPHRIEDHLKTQIAGVVDGVTRCLNGRDGVVVDYLKIDDLRVISFTRELPENRNLLLMLNSTSIWQGMDRGSVYLIASLRFKLHIAREKQTSMTREFDLILGHPVRLFTIYSKYSEIKAELQSRKMDVNCSGMRWMECVDSFIRRLIPQIPRDRIKIKYTYDLRTHNEPRGKRVDVTLRAKIIDARSLLNRYDLLDYYQGKPIRFSLFLHNSSDIP